jgi:2-hydroxychromene-2-carboxylate isomerase
MTSSPATFYFDLSSPFAYLAATRIDELIPGVTWRPIAFGIVLREIDRVPWSLRGGREAIMEEIERRAAERGLPPIRWAEGWPGETYSLAPPRGAVVAEHHGRLREFTLAAFRLHFAEGRRLDADDIVRAGVEAGLDGDEVRAGVEDPKVKARLAEYTDEALARGVTGIPTVAVDGALFWGDDRLEEAAAAASSQS